MPKMGFVRLEFGRRPRGCPSKRRCVVVFIERVIYPRYRSVDEIDAEGRATTAGVPVPVQSASSPMTCSPHDRAGDRHWQVRRRTTGQPHVAPTPTSLTTDSRPRPPDTQALGGRECRPDPPSDLTAMNG